MRHTYRKLVVAIVCLAILYSSVVASSFAYPDQIIKPNVEKIIKSEIIKGAVAQKQVTAFRKHSAYTTLHQDLLAKGFRPAKTAGVPFVAEASFTDEKGKLWKTTTVLDEVAATRGKDTATVGQVSLSSDKDEVKTYDFYFVNPNGNFSDDSEAAIEHYIGSNGKILKANSWKSCMKKKIRESVSKCAGPCVAAAVSCTGTVAAYLLCVGAACGGCFAFNFAVASVQCAFSW